MLRLVKLEQIPSLCLNGVEVELWKKVYVWIDVPVEDGFAFSEEYEQISHNVHFLTKNYSNNELNYVVKCSDGVTVCVSGFELFTKILKRYKTNTYEEKNIIAKVIIQNHVKKLLNEKKILPGKK